MSGATNVYVRCYDAKKVSNSKEKDGDHDSPSARFRLLLSNPNPSPSPRAFNTSIATFTAFSDLDGFVFPRDFRNVPNDCAFITASVFESGGEFGTGDPWSMYASGTDNFLPEEEGPAKDASDGARRVSNIGASGFECVRWWGALIVWLRLNPLPSSICIVSPSEAANEGSGTLFRFRMSGCERFGCAPNIVLESKSERSAMVESNEELVPLTAALTSEDGDKERDPGKDRSSPWSGM